MANPRYNSSRSQAQALLYYIFDLIICGGQSAAAWLLEKDKEAQRVVREIRS